MDRLDDGIRQHRKQALDKMRTWDRFGFCAAAASELGPDAAEGRKRPILIQGEPLEQDNWRSIKVGVTFYTFMLPKRWIFQQASPSQRH